MPFQSRNYGGSLILRRKKRKRAHFSVAFHRKWAFPIATIIFSALAVPLAILTGRQGRGFGVLSSLGLVAGYYYIGRAAELSARKLELTPWLAAWLPNIIGVLLIALFWWFVQRRRDEIFRTTNSAIHVLGRSNLARFERLNLLCEWSKVWRLSKQT